MKKFYMTMAAMLFGAAAMAQIGTLSSEDLTATKGGDTAYLQVYLNADDVTAVSGAQFDLVLPDGVTIAQIYDEEEDDFVDDVTFPMAKAKHQTGYMKTTSGALMFYAAAETSVSFRTNTNVLVKIGLAVDKTVADGAHAIGFKRVVLSDKSEVVKSYDLSDFEVTLTVSGDAIHGINADDVNAPIYNIAGQRVSKAQKGVFIQNGKKVAVK